MMTEQETYTVTTKSGVTTFYNADNLVDAWLQAFEDYKDVDAVRLSFYKEWMCGLDCGYDADGRHWKKDDENVKQYAK